MATKYAFRISSANDAGLCGTSKGASANLRARTNRDGTQSLTLSLQSGSTTIVYTGTLAEPIPSLLDCNLFELQVSDSYGRQYDLRVHCDLGRLHLCLTRREN